MAEIAKGLIHWGVVAKVESVYGTAVSLSTSTDGVQVIEIPEVTEAYAFDGQRGRPAGTGAPQISIAPNGRTMNFTLKVEGKGGGAAYSASVKPRDFHTLGLASGLTSTLVTTGGSESYTYAATAGPTGYDSATVSIYKAGELYPLNGCYATLDWEATNGGPGIFTFTGQGRVNAAFSDDASTPKSITYAPTILPPAVAPLTLTVNSVTSLVVRSAKVSLGRDLSPRVDLNASGGHAGFAPGLRNPTFSFVCEAPALSAIDFYTLRSAGTEFASSLIVGSTQYNKYKWTFPQGKIRDIKMGADAQVPTLEVTVGGYASSPILNDAFSLLFN